MSGTAAVGEEEVPIVWNIPFQKNPYFTGRDDVLTDLHSTFAAKKKIVLTQPQVISGLGGIGKTQTALEYAYRYREDYRYIFWTRADTNELLVSDFASIASLLDLPVKDDKNQDLSVSAVKHWLQTHNDWLLILDNADDLEMVRNFLPTRLQGHILLTSRESATGTDIQGIEIENMTPEDGVIFLLRRSKFIALDAAPDTINETDWDKAREIVELMGGLPLALAQAGAYIERIRCSLSGYIERYQQRRMKLLQERRGLTADHPEPVAATWSLSFEKVEQSIPAAADLLCLCAFLHPDAIPEEMIVNGASELSPVLASVATDVFEFDDTITALFKYSLIRRNSDSKTLTIHRLVQVVLKDEMDEDTQRQWAERVVRVVNRAFPNVTFDVWQQCQLCLPHAQVCATLINQWQITFPEATQLLNKAGHYLRERGQYTEAEQLLTQALKICEQIQVTEQLDTSYILNDLAELWRLQGKYIQAEPLHQRALMIREQFLGPIHSDTATSLNNLAMLYQNQGHFKDAEPLFKRALAIREQTLGPEHPDTAASLSNLATLYQDQGHFKDAEPLFKHALAIREQVLGAEHPDTAIGLGCLALLYQAQGHFKDAEPLFKRALAIREQVLGPEHPDTAASLNNLATLYQDQGHFKDAEPLFKRTLAICEQALGAEHPYTATSLSNLATLYQAQGHFKDAEPLSKRALAIQEQALGPEHPDTATSLSNLAMLYKAQGHFKDAETLSKRALAIKEQALGPEHPRTAASLNNLATLYQAQGYFKDAEPLFKNALTICEQALGPRHPDTATSLSNLAILYQDQGRYIRAEPLLKRAFAIREQVLGSKHPDTAASLSSLASFYLARNNYQRAEPLYQRALAIYEQILGLTHPKTVIALESYARMLRMARRNSRAAEMEARAEAIRKKQQEENI